jgi:hypothetical protein
MNHAAIFKNRKFRLGESIDEERNQESCREEESGSEEKEVVQRAPKGARSFNVRPRQRGLFYLLFHFLTNFCTALFTVSAT